ncbi:MAG: TetR/AcrR family transcriptional regulator, partial [Actinobacteria bacterium]|nr:TetR/AcrR family transcriptional regulator [Actinomycetota bacterium]
LSASSPKLQRHVAEAFSRWESALTDTFASMKNTRRLNPAARPTLLAQTTLAAVQGGYLLSTARHDIHPMRTALNTAYNQLRASRLID